MLGRGLSLRTTVVSLIALCSIHDVTFYLSVFFVVVVVFFPSLFCWKGLNSQVQVVVREDQLGRSKEGLQEAGVYSQSCLCIPAISSPPCTQLHQGNGGDC